MVDVDVPYYEEAELKIWEKSFRLDGVDPVVNTVGGVSIDDSEEVKMRAKKRVMGRDVKCKDIMLPGKLGEHRVVGKKRHMHEGSHTWLPEWGKK